MCGDVTGKGVEAAVHAKRIRNAVRTASHVDRSPAWILGLVNKVLVSDDDTFSERLATATCVRLRPDTHVLRVSNRIGLSRGKTPLAVEADLLAKIPPEYGVYAHHWLILHGRYVCKARKPACAVCLINDICRFPDKTL